MTKVLITGAGSYVGESVRNYILGTAPEQYQIDSVDTMGDNWKWQTTVSMMWCFMWQVLRM